MKLKAIENYKDYFISSDGKVFSKKSGKLKELKLWKDSKDRYLMVSLSRKGEKKNLLVHRLVAKAFLENKEKNKNIVDHIDKNTKNNKVENLRWVTTRENVVRGFETKNQVRNFRTCMVKLNGKFEKYFRSIEEASKYLNKHYNTSLSGMSKYKRSNKGDIEITTI